MLSSDVDSARGRDRQANGQTERQTEIDTCMSHSVYNAISGSD